MKILKPQTLILSYSSVPGSSYPEWAIGDSFEIGDNVKITDSGETEYECLIANTADADNSPADDTNTWLNLGASNKYKMLDDYINTQTVDSAGSLVVELTTTDYADALALFDVSGTTITIQMYSGPILVSEESTEVFGNEYLIDNWADYFFSGFEVFPDFNFDVQGLYLNLKIKITITQRDGKVGLGHCIAGRYVELGKTKYEPKVGIEDYSVQKVNDFGETYLNKRAYAKTGTAEIALKTNAISKVTNILAAARSTPCLYQLNNDSTTYEPLLIYGFYRDFSVVMQDFNQSVLSIEIEGMI